MRRFNAILSMCILALFLVHAVAGGLIAAGVLPGGNPVMHVLAWVMLGMIGVHMLLGIKLTADTLRTIRKSGAGYFRENQLFWIRRASGFAIMIFIVSHLVLFRTSTNPVRLHDFGGAALVSQLLLVISIALHVLTNIRPLMLALGAKKYRTFLLDVLVITSALLLAAGIGFVVYFIRFNL